MDININEIIRYLGYGKSKPDERTMNLIRECIFALKDAVNPKSTYRRFGLNISDDGVIEAGGLSFKSENLVKNLNGCHEVIFFAATLGNGADMLMNRYSRLQISKAAILQATAAAMIEEYCNECQLIIQKELEKEKCYLRPRFSPGYGDFALEIQREFLDILNASKTVGIVLSDGGVMIPEKSVTAVMGISRTNSRCHIEGCESCTKKNCRFRRNN